MRRLYILGILLPVLLSCQSLKVKDLTAQRCLASSSPCEALLKPSPTGERVSLSYPSSDPFPLSPLTLRVAHNLKLLEVPYELLKYDHPDAGPVTVELTFTQFIEAYESLPGGRELVSLLGGEYESGDQLKLELTKWVDRYIPDYSIGWGYEGDSTFIEQGEFFDSLERKNIPIANHHDLLAHLFLFADSELRELTERLATTYDKAVRYGLKFPLAHPSSNFSDIVNSLWVRLQEHTPVEYQDAEGQRRLAIIGGYPSVVDPLQPYRGYLLDWIYLADMDKILHQINFEIKNSSDVKKGQEAQKLYSEVVNELEIILKLPLKDNEQVLASIDQEFNLVSLLTPDYQGRWKEFSKRVIEGRNESVLVVLRPSVHRRLMHKTLSLIEIILADDPPNN